MHDPRTADLAREAEQYLALVEVFRAEGYEPHWRPEPMLELSESRARARRSSPTQRRQT